MQVVTTFQQARSSRRGRFGLVPTMGSLHDGHRSLLSRARTECDSVAVSIFVNPRQFDDPADLDRYPRPLDVDLAMCQAEGIDTVFVPALTEVYPAEPLTRVSISGISDRLEGAERPGHFDGVALVVTKLLAGIQPDRGYFGRKDAQQLAVIRTLVSDLSIPTEVVACSTVREPDGLAMSSRNVFLDPDERQRALGLSRGLFKAADAAESGERDADTLVDIARSEMAEVDAIEYVQLASQDRAEPMPTIDRPAFLAVAARVGATRLIDNVAIDLEGETIVVDRGLLTA